MSINITAPSNQSPDAAYGLYFFEGDIIRAARPGSWNFYKSATTKESIYYFNTTETDDYIGRSTGILVKGNGGYYLEVQRPKPVYGFIPGTWGLPAFVAETGYIFMGSSAEYFYQNFSIDGRAIKENSTITDTTATTGSNGGTVVITKTPATAEKEPVPVNVPQAQPKGPMYALIAVLVLAGIGIAYLTFRKPTKR